MRRAVHLLIFPALAVVVLDQATKYLVHRAIPLYGSRCLIDGFFNLVHIRNRGLVFGILNRPGIDYSRYFLIGATFIAVGLLIYWFIRLKNQGTGMILALSLILGGAVGNLLDRLRLGEVVDFLDFYVGAYHWPAFNVADSAITAGTFWLALQLLFRYPSQAGAVKK